MAFSASESQRLKLRYGPWALVTGASSGIGKTLAEGLAASGIHLILVSRQQQVLESVAVDLQSRYQIHTRVVCADLSTAAGVASVLEQSSDLEIGLMVHAAGFGTSGLFGAVSLESEWNMLQVNCAALLPLTHHFARYFKERRKGGILLLSSILAFQGVPYAAHYAATKAYVQSFGEALAIELKPFNVDVLTAAPGPVASGFADRANMKLGRTMKPSDIAAPILKSLGRRSTLFPGLLTKVLIYSLRTVPRWAKVLILSKIMGGFTKHQRK